MRSLPRDAALVDEHAELAAVDVGRHQVRITVCVDVAEVDASRWFRTQRLDSRRTGRCARYCARS
jgi:hypothetical protein